MSNDNSSRYRGGMGHGHVKPNENGSVARCGGPAICKECALELAQVEKERRNAVLVPSTELAKLQAKLKLAEEALGKLIEPFTEGEEVDVYWPVSQNVNHACEASGRGVVTRVEAGSLWVRYREGGTNWVAGKQCRRVGALDAARTALAEILKAEGPSNVAFAATKGSEE